MEALKSLPEDIRVYVFIIGTIVIGFVLSQLINSPKAAKKHVRKQKYAGKPRAMHSEKWQEFKLIEKEQLSHDSFRFRFELQSSLHVLGLPIGQHISLKYYDKAEDKEVQRSYTPISSDDEHGYVDFVVKIYHKNTHEKFPNGGAMSQYLYNMKINDSIHMKGPKGHLEYLDDEPKPNGDVDGGVFTIKKPRKDVVTKNVKHLGLIAGGTGITPILQVARAVFKSSDKIHMHLIYANQTEEDILLREEIDKFAKEYPVNGSSNDAHKNQSTFQVYYTLDRPPSDWKYGSGFITKDMCAKHLPKAINGGVKENTMVLMCGPKPMITFACEPALKDLGYDETQMFTF